jgi:hypothetical protein
MTNTLTPVYGQIVTLSAHVDTALPAGTVTFFDGMTSLGAVAVDAQGNAALSFSSLTPGVHTLRVVFGGDANHAASTAPDVIVTVSSAATTVSLVSAANPVVPNDDITLTAVVSVVAPGSGTRTGTVTFKEGTTVLGTAQLANDGTATLIITGRAVGSFNFTAEYAGDANFLASTSGTLVLQVGLDATVSLSATPNPVLYLDTVTLTAEESASGGTPPSGTVTFMQGATTLGAATITGGVAMRTWTADAPIGAQTLRAIYSGDTLHAAGAESSVVLTVNTRTPVLTLAQSTETSSEGEAVTFTATLELGATPSAPVSLTLTFFDGDTALSSALPVQNGVATFTTNALGVGQHALSARFDGATGFAPTASALLVHIVTGAGSGSGGTGETGGEGAQAENGGAAAPKRCGCQSASESFAPLLLVIFVLGLRRHSRRKDMPSAHQRR